jgi:Transglycosylase SLT domain
MYKEICLSVILAVLLMLLSLYISNNSNITKITNTKLLKLDSLVTYSQNINIISKTIIISNPTVPEIEAKYYAIIFYDISHKYNIDVTSFIALIHIESNWSPVLTSNKNCKGLTQISKLTEIDECSKLGINYKENVTEWDDIANILIGLDYFASRYQKSGLDYAIKAYVGGDNYKQASSINGAYIDKYTKDFTIEYIKTKYIYHGVEYELGYKK